jgi:hypothetical protein
LYKESSPSVAAEYRKALYMNKTQSVLNKSIMMLAIKKVAQVTNPLFATQCSLYINSLDAHNYMKWVMVSSSL